MISTWEKGKKPEQALQLFEEMQRRGLQPNVITFHAVVSACEKGKQPEQALQLFGKMQRRCLGRVLITFNAVIRACNMCGMF